MNTTRTCKAAADDDEFITIFVRSFRHWKTGALITRPDGKPFPLRIRRRK